MGVLAVDLGSSSARVAYVDEALRQKEIGRIAHQATKIGGYYRFDTERLFGELIRLIDSTIDAFKVESIGICSWGVDYGLIDSSGKLVDLPISYRDGRTKEIFSGRDLKADYLRSGIYPMSINTVYQLLADKAAGRLKSGCRMAMIADLLAYRLTGAVRAERTNASTTGMLRSDGSDWDYELIDSLGLERGLFPELIDSGELYGCYRGVNVTAVPSHDTAAAVYAMGDMDDDTAFISSGSWILVGKLIDEPIIGARAYECGFTNERGCGGRVTFLKNINGLYVVQRIAAETGISYKEIDEGVGGAKALGVFDVNEAGGANDICGAIKRMLNVGDAPPLSLVRSAYDSIAAAITEALGELSELTGRKITKAFLTGGMARAPYLLDKFKNASGLSVEIIDSEGAAAGNARSQLAALRLGK